MNRVRNIYWEKFANTFLADPQTHNTIDLKTIQPPINWKTLFGNENRVEIEIGSGKGRFLRESAKKDPNVNYLGIEYTPKYALLTRDRLAKYSITNVKIIRCDAVYFVDRYVADRSVSAFHIYFPDPWPKKRHHKRRLFNDAIWLSELDRTLKSNGKIHVATDFADYFAEIREKLDRYENFEFLPDESARDDHVQTSFEIKYRKENRKIFRAIYAKN